MNAKTTFFPVGNGDMTLVTSDNQKMRTRRQSAD